MRDVVRPHISRFRPQDVDIAFMTRPEAAKFEFEDVKTAVLQLLIKSGLISPEKK